MTYLTNKSDAIVTGITAAPSVPGPLSVGRSVVFTLATSQAVTVSGSPVLTLNNGATASYDPTSSTPISLLFDYTVAAGQDSTDLTVGGLVLNGAAITVPSTAGFAAATSYAAGVEPTSVAVADVNGDGHPDLVVADAGGDDVDVLLNNGSGGFQAAASYAATGNPASVAVADVNGDGHPDLVVAASNGGVDVLLNNGSGGFQAATSYAAGVEPASVAVADVNGDGHPDLVVADRNGGADVLLNNGSGGFQAATSYAAGVEPTSVAVADVNGDGHPDLVVADYSVVDSSGGDVDVLLNNGSGGFQAATSYAAGVEPASVAVADVNGDGHPDLVVADRNGGADVLLNNGSGGFQAADYGFIEGFPIAVAVADVNGDGHSDLVVTDSNGNVDVLLNNGSGGFQAATYYAAGLAPVSVAVTDVNGDGHPDLVVADLYGGVDVLLNSSQAVGSFAAASASSAPGTNTGLVIDTTPPTVTAMLLTDTGSSTIDGITSKDALTGTAEAGGTVTISNGATVLGTTTAATNGSWSYVPTGLADGSHTLTASETDAAGNTGTTSVSFTLDTTIPGRPGNLSLAPASDSGVAGDDVTRINKPVITGTGAVGDLVTLYDNNTVIGAASVDGGGTWSITTSLLSDGMHSLAAIQTDVAGNVSPSSSQRLGLTIDTVAPGAPTLTETAVSTGPASPALTGTAEAESTVTLYDGATELGTTTADPSGDYSFTVARSLSDGTHTLTAVATDAADNLSRASAALSVQVNANQSYAVVLGTDANGDVMSKIYDSTGQYSSIDITGSDGLLLQSVSATTTLRNIYDSNGELIGTVSGPGSSTGAPPEPGFDTVREAQGASTTTDSSNSVITLLKERNTLMLTGNDTVDASGGDATISAAANAASIQGGTGTLAFYGGSVSSTVSGGAGSATVLGGDGGGVFQGGTAGRNVLVAGGGNTTLVGAVGDDVMYGSASGHDQMFAGSGPETFVAGGGASTLVGGSGGDVMFGGAGASTIYGGTAGGDTVVAGSGSTLFVGGAGQSTLFGGAGDDTVWTGAGSMTVVLGAAQDQVNFGTGSSTTFAGQGTDLFTAVAGSGGGNDVISGVKVGTDSIALFGYDTSAVLTQNGGGNTVLSLSDGTRITLLGVQHLSSGSII